MKEPFERGALVTWPGKLVKDKIYIYMGERSVNGCIYQIILNPQTGAELVAWKEDLYQVEGRQ